MKRIFLLACICMAVSLSAFAQNRQGGQGGQRGPRHNMDAVVDTAIINHMDLEAETLQKVLQLQSTKQAEQREMMGSLRSNRGQRMSEEDRNAMRTKMQDFTAQYRKDLRAILGDDLYISYLEKYCDRQAMMRMMRPGMQGGQRPQMGGPRGDFGGDNGFGGGDGGF